jgi:hypothetical protein
MKARHIISILREFLLIFISILVFSIAFGQTLPSEETFTTAREKIRQFMAKGETKTARSIATESLMEVTKGRSESRLQRAVRMAEMLYYVAESYRIDNNFEAFLSNAQELSKIYPGHEALLSFTHSASVS